VSICICGLESGKRDIDFDQISRGSVERNGGDCSCFIRLSSPARTSNPSLRLPKLTPWIATHLDDPAKRADRRR